MNARWTATVVWLGAASACLSGTSDEAREKAKRAASYVLLAESVSRVSLQVGGMLDKHPFDRALAWYARGLGRLHVSLYQKLTPPDGAESLHKQFSDAVAHFARMADAHYQTDYPSARKHREQCVKEFLQALGELHKMKRKGIVPAMSHGAGERR